MNLVKSSLLTSEKLTHRQRQAQATQTLIVDTSRELFLEQGYGATTIEAIAEKAGVAVSTVYAIFKNKRGILSAIREAWHQASGQRDIYVQALEESDPTRRLQLVAHATRRQWETGSAMLAIYTSAAAVDPEAAAEQNKALSGRRAHLTRFLTESANMLKPELKLEHAVSIFFTLTLPELYESLTRREGWSPEEYEMWLADVLKQQLFSEKE